MDVGVRATQEQLPKDARNKSHPLRQIQRPRFFRGLFFTINCALFYLDTQIFSIILMLFTCSLPYSDMLILIQFWIYSG